MRHRRRRNGGGGYGLAGVVCAVLLVLLGAAGWWAMPAGLAPDQAIQAVQGLVLPTPAPVFAPDDPRENENPDPALPRETESPEEEYRPPLATPQPSPQESEADRLYRLIRQAADQEQRTVQVTTSDQALLEAAADRVIRDPEFFWLQGWSAQSVGDDWQLTFLWKYEDVSARRAQVEQAAAAALAALPAGAGEYETALALHDWLCENIVYEFSTDGSDQDLYGALVNGRCVCAGYAAAYEYLLNRLGIPAWTVRGPADNGSGQPEAHAWTKMQLEGEIYYTDVTWDDAEDGYERFWFCLTSDRMGRTHTADPSQGEEMTPSAAVGCNYMIRNGYMLDLFSPQALAAVIQAQPGNSFVVGAADPDTYAQLEAFVQDSDAFADLLRQLGLASGSVSWNRRTITGSMCMRITLN